MHLLIRYKIWVLLVFLLVLNAMIFWPKKKANGASDDRSFPPGPPGQNADGRPPVPDEKMKARFEAMMKNMTEEERKAFEERRKADQAFFESIKNLPEAERRQKMEEHRAANPPPGPPPGEKKGDDTAGGSGGSGGGPGGQGGGPGGDGTPHIPAPSARRGMDQQIVNSQKGSS